MEEDNKLVRSNKLRIIVSSLIIASVLVVFIDLLFPLSENQRMLLRIFDFAVVVILGLDFVARLKFSKNKSKFILRHLYEFPAMIPLIITGAADSSSLLYFICTCPTVILISVKVFAISTYTTHLISLL